MRRSLSAFSLAVVLAAPSVVIAQTREITGTVTVTGTNTPVADATVSVIGSTAVTRTGPNGTFRLIAPTGPVTMAARAIGYRRVTTPVPAGQNTVNFTLERDVLQLEGVVVTGQATTVERANAAVAVSTVSAEALNRVPAVSVENALQGKVVGARINMNSGAPGGGGQVQIRGVTTILGNGEPLFVVDGVIISNAQVATGANTVTGATGGGAISSVQENATNRLADINPADIANIEILKGAAASAIYGSRASNGVVVITTKRGQSGAPRFQLSQRVGTSRAVNLLSTRRFPSRDEAILAVRKFHTADRATAIVDSVTQANGGQLPYYDYLAQLYGETPMSYETTGSVSGGIEGTRYYASLSSKQDGGIARNTDARRDVLHLTIDQTLGSRWIVAVGGDLVRTKANRGISNNNNQSFASPLYNFGYTPAIINLDSRTADGLYVRNPLPAGGGRLASNPFETLAHVKNQEDVYRMLGNSRVSFEALSGDVHRLTLSANGGVDRYNQTGQVYSPNFMQYEGRDGFFGRSVETTSNSLRANGALNGVWSFSPRALPAVFRTSGGLVQEFEDFSTVRVQARGLIPGIEKVNQGNIATNHDRSRIVDQAFYAQEEIAAFDDRVNVNFGLRADRSSANGDREKFYMFPKASAAYTFREPVAYVDRFKLRASVGQSGNRPRYGDRDITLQNNFRIGGQEGIGANPTLGNPDVKPERMTEQEYGFDATFAGARLALEATYFDRQITDLLLNAPLVNSSGLTQQIFNGGDMSSRGIELGLTVNPVRNWRGLGWVSRTNFFSIDQVVDSLPVSPFVVANSGFGTAYGRSRIAQGISTTAIWGNMPFYADATGKPLRVAPYGARLVGVDYSAVPGATQLVTRDTVVADATPDFEMSFSNEFTFRGFTLTALLDWRKGGYTSNLTNNLYDEGFTAYDYDKQVAVQRPGKADTTYKLGNYRYGSWATGQDARAYVQNGTFVKLREITLGYSVPEALVQRVLSGRGRDMRVNLSARNLAIWSAYWGMDPEVSNFGNQNVGRFVDLAPFPPSRSFFLSFDVGF